MIRMGYILLSEGSLLSGALYSGCLSSYKFLMLLWGIVSLEVYSIMLFCLQVHLA